MTASIVSTLAGADALTYLVCFAPLTLIFLVAATEIIHECGAVAIEAFHKYRITAQEALYEYYVTLRKEVNTEDQVMKNYSTSRSSRVNLKDLNLTTDAHNYDLLENTTTINTNDTDYAHSDRDSSMTRSSIAQKQFDHTRGSQKRGLLDLPAEIRNVIYELISTPLADTQPYICEQYGYRIQVDMSTKFHLSSLGQTCRQIHEEYMSFLLAKHEVTFTSLYSALKWQANIDKRFTAAVRRYAIKSNMRITKDPTWPMSTTRERGWARLPFLIVDFRAYYWKYAGVTYFIYVFFCPEEEFALCAQSTSLVKSVLTAAPFNSSYFTFDHFLNMADQISLLRLHSHQDRISNNRGSAEPLFPPSFAVDDQGLRLGYETKIEIGEDIFRPPMEN